MNSLYIHYQHPDIIVALQEDEKIKAIKTIEHKKVGTYLGVTIQELALMTNNNVINAFFVNLMPAPIFMQRTILATINGISCGMKLLGKKIDIYGVDGFLGLYEIYQKKSPHKKIIALSNAYGNDLFYLFIENNEVKSGVLSMQDIITLVKHFYSIDAIIIVGDITEIEEEKLKKELSEKIECSPIKNLTMEEFVSIAAKKIDSRDNLTYLLPIYTKLHVVEKTLQKT